MSKLEYLIQQVDKYILFFKMHILSLTLILIEFQFQFKPSILFYPNEYLIIAAVHI